MKAVVTGGAGFIGCNLADRLADGGAQVVVLDALARPGVERNLSSLLSPEASARPSRRALFFGVNFAQCGR